MTAIRTLIIDDEPAARRGIRLLAEADPAVSIVGECPDGARAVKAIESLKPDLVFLDVQMPGLDGFQVLQAVSLPRLPYVVFVTAYDRYAIDAFNVHAVDYLLKPFSDARFREALEQAKDRLRAQDLGDLRQWISVMRSHDPAGGSGAMRGRIAVRDRDRIVLLDVASIRWIEAQKDYAALHTDSRTWLVRSTIKDLHRTLDPRRFVRIHRSTVVNLDEVRELRPLFRGEYVALLRDGTELRVSRRRRDELADALQQPL